MPATITRTVTWTGTNTTSNPNFEWVNVNSVDWVTRVDSSTINQSDFTIADNDTGAVRTSQWEVRHWNWVNDNTLVDSFTITQAAEGAVTTTTTEPPTYTITYQAVANPSDIVGTHPSTVSGVSAGNYTVSGPTWTVTGMTFIGYAEGDSAQSPVNIQPGDVITITGDKTLYAKYVATTTTSTSTSTTTNAPVTYSLTLGSGTSGAQALQFTEANPNSHTINYTQSPNSGTPAVQVDDLPAWLTSGGITDSEIQLSLSANSNDYPADSVGFNMTYRHGDAPVGQGEDELYVEFIAAPANSILIDNTTVFDSFTEAPDGEGYSNYVHDNSGSDSTALVIYAIALDPDAELTSSEVYWSDTLPSASGHTATPSPYWAGSISIDNTYTLDGNEALVSFQHQDASGPGSLPGKNAPLTEEQAGTQSTSSLGENQRYLIIKHPNDSTHACSVLITAPNGSTTTTTTQAPSNTFYWSVPGGSNGNGLSAGNLYPADYGQYTGPVPGDNHSVTPGHPYVAGGVFYLWGEYNAAGTSNAITTAPSGGWAQHITTPSYIDFTSATWSSTVDMWKFQFNTDQTDDGFPNDVDVDRIAQIHCDVTPTRSTYKVIIDASESCHVAGTVMNLADGSTKLIEDLQVGDVLASYDIAGLGHDETTSTWQEYSSQINQFSATSQSAEVKNIWSSEFGKYVNFNNGLTKVTEEHPVLVKDSGNNISFKQVLDVVIGDSFYINGTWVEITSKEIVEETITAYKIDVEELDVYLADGILWHNTIEAKMN